MNEENPYTQQKWEPPRVTYGDPTPWPFIALGALIGVSLLLAGFILLGVFL